MLRAACCEIAIALEVSSARFITSTYLAVREIVICYVPSGFKQYFPPDSKKPVLDEQIEYILSVGAGTGGGIRFNLD